MSYCLQIKKEIYVHDRKLLWIKEGKGKSSITKKKTIKNLSLHDGILNFIEFWTFIIDYIYFLFFYVRLSYFYFLEFLNE